MRSNFNSSSYSFSPSSPLSYSSSSSQLGFRRSSATTPSHGLSPRSPAEFSPRGDSFQRDSILRESLPARLFPHRSSSLVSRSQEPSVGRVTRDEQTIGLLERYGNSSSNGARKTSVGENSTLQLLKQRRQQQLEPDVGTSSSIGQRRQSLNNFDSLFQRDQPSTSSARQNPPDAQDVSQNEYIQRLLAAHNRVDDLLRSRGLNNDDERKYLRAWEEIPIIREERYRRIRTPSNSSDSGLSTDNDSDRSNAEAAPPELEASESFCFEREEEEVQIVHVHKQKTKVIAVSYTEKLKNVDCKLNKKQKSEKVAKSYALPSAPDHCSLSIAKSNDLNATSKQKGGKICDTKAVFPSRIKEEVSIRLPAAPTPKVLAQAKHELKKVPIENSNCSKVLKSSANKAEKIEKNLVDKCQSIAVRASFSVGDGDMKNKKKPVLPKRRKTYDDHVKVQQKNILASLKRKKLNVIPSTAEISIQHCSFYNQIAKDNFAEKNVRLNLRMTERAPKTCSATVTLPSPPRVVYVRKDISIFSARPKPRRTKTMDLQKPKPIGRLHRAFTVELEKEEKEQRKVNRLKIPEYFLQSNAEMLEDLMGVKNGLKRVPIIGGFLVQPKPKPAAQPQSTLRRAGAIRRKPTPIKEECAPYSDFCPPPPAPSSPIPQIRIMRPLEPDPPPIPRQRRQPPTMSSKHLNLHGSLARSATPRGATNYESKHQPKHYAELSETDKLLIERFGSRIHVPRPNAIIRAFSSLHAIRALIKDRCASPPAMPRFIQRKSPRIRSPSPSREPKPLKLNSIVISKKCTPRRHWLDFQVDLKRVDFDKHRSRNKPRRLLLRWIPRWRRRGTDEEVEEVDEEEVEEAASEVESRSERVTTKSFTEDEEGLTEGERAMAAAKRRHEDEQQSKLQDYEERRRAEREKEEEELKKLKEKQERRKLEREQEERDMEERRKAADDRRRQEEEDKKMALEESKRKKEEEKNKRNQLMGGTFQTGGSGRNFTVEKKKNDDKFGNIVQAKQEMGMTKDQQEEAKRAYMAVVIKGIPTVDEVLPGDLRAKIKELHQRICKLETEKYDLEKRHERQEYDMKELNERQRQVTRNSALKKGIDPAEVGNSRYPPKQLIVSKFERKYEGRSFSERMEMFSKRNAHPCFPGIAPPPANFDKVILAVELKKTDSTTHEHTIPDDIQAYLNSPDRCPKYTEKEPSEPTVSKMAYTPKRLSIPTAFLRHG